MIGAEEIRRYQSLRKAGKKLSGELLKAIPKSVLVSTARELGLWKQGILVADEGDINVLTDRMIYDRRWNGRNSLEHLEADLAESTLPEDERRYFRAMKTGRFSLFEIQSTHPGGFSMTSGVSFPFTPDKETAIMKCLREKEPGFGKKRLDMPEDYSLYFYRLRKRFGIEVRYESAEEEEEREDEWEA